MQFTDTNGRSVGKFEFYELALQKMAEIDKTKLELLYSSWISQLNETIMKEDELVVKNKELEIIVEINSYLEKKGVSDVNFLDENPDIKTWITEQIETRKEEVSKLKRELNIRNNADLEYEIMNENRKNIMWRNFSESEKWKAYVSHDEYTHNWDEKNTNTLLIFVKTKIDAYYKNIKGVINMQNIVNEKCPEYPTLHHYCNVDNGNDNGNAGGSKPRKTKRHKSRKTKRRSKRKRV